MLKRRSKIILVILAMILQIMPNMFMTITAKEQSSTNDINLQVTAYQGVYDRKEHNLIQSLQVDVPDAKYEICIGSNAVCNNYQNYQDNLTKEEVINHANLIIKEVGTYSMYIKAYNETRASQRIKVTANIAQRLLEIRSADATKTYDGTPLTNGKYSIAPATATSGLLSGDQVALQVTGSITEIGSTVNTIENIQVVDATGNDVRKNYNIQTYLGTLIVKQALKNTVYFDDKTVTYNGGYQSLDPATSDLDNTTYLYSIDNKNWNEVMPSYNEVGRYEIFVQALHPEAKTVSGKAVLIIEKRPLKITASSAEKKFDNTPLTSSQYTIEGILAVEEEITSVDVIGSQTEIGVSRNRIANVVIMQGDFVVTDNYAIEYVDGELKVTENLIGLTIRYVYADGQQGNIPLPQTYEAELNYLTPYSITVPEIDGYKADKDIIQGTMPLDAVDITVTYTRNPVIPVMPVDPERPVNPQYPIEPNTPILITRNVNPVNAQNPLFNPNPVDETISSVETIEENPTPLTLPKEEIHEDETPLAKPEGSWALWNLVFALASLGIGFSTLLLKNKKENEDDPNLYKRRKSIKILSVLTGILSIIVFLITEDISLPMVMVDEWTFTMAILLMVQILEGFISRKWKEVEKDSLSEKA